MPPRWGFPAAVWRDAPEPATQPAPPIRRLRLAAALAVVTAGFAVIAAGAEAWRFTLLLAGRTQVLSGQQVRFSDALVISAGLMLPVAAVATALAAVPVLVRLHGDAARRAGLVPSRRPGEVTGWLLTPLVNVYGAGVIVGEIDGRLSDSAGAGRSAGRARLTRLVAVWWSVWVLNGVLVLAALARGLGASLQAVADTVELHVAVNLSAALAAGLSAALLTRWAGLLTPPRPPRPGWRVAPPAPTRPAAHLVRRRASPAGADPAVVDPAQADPAVVDPAQADPAVVDPAVVDPALAGPAAAVGSAPETS